MCGQAVTEGAFKVLLHIFYKRTYTAGSLWFVSLFSWHQPNQYLNALCLFSIIWCKYPHVFPTKM